MFEKGKHLFGLDKASIAIRKDDRAVVVEGYFDVIALHAAGITNAVASLGTALSSQQIHPVVPRQRQQADRSEFRRRRRRCPCSQSSHR